MGKVKGRKVKPVLMNLELDDPDDSDSGSQDGAVDADLVEKETKMTETLVKALSQCVRCGKGVPCKIGKDSSHIRPSFNQIGAWVKCLVRSL